ncbi:hypothetical protein VZO05_06315 [Aggregatilineales bacterium SYSU G02658]
MNIWQFQNRLSRRLLAWGVGSTLCGVFLLRGGAFWRGVGWQFIGWGVIDALIALFGRNAAESRIDSLENPGLESVQAEETEKLTRLLWINAGLDVLYMLGGKQWADGDKGDGSRAGHGLGIVLQAAFLLFFDLYHALTAPKSK